MHFCQNPIVKAPRVVEHVESGNSSDACPTTHQVTRGPSSDPSSDAGSRFRVWLACDTRKCDRKKTKLRYYKAFDSLRFTEA